MKKELDLSAHAQSIYSCLSRETNGTETADPEKRFYAAKLTFEHTAHMSDTDTGCFDPAKKHSILTIPPCVKKPR